MKNSAAAGNARRVPLSAPFDADRPDGCHSNQDRRTDLRSLLSPFRRLLPAASAGSLAQMMLTAVALSMIFNAAGLVVSYQFDLPAGATIVLIAGAVFLLSTGSRYLRRAPAADGRGLPSS